MKKIIYFLLFLVLTNISWGQNGTTRITVITHGFTPVGNSTASGIDDWKEFALRIRKKSGGGTVYINNIGTGEWQILNPIRGLQNGIGAANEHKIFLYNWATYSNDLADGGLEASADNLFALLINSPVGNIFDNYWHTHFIGHSRGNILLLQVAHRILSKFPSKTINQFTLLDPHPAIPMNDASSSSEGLSLPGIYGLPTKSLLCVGYDKIGTLNIKLPNNVLKSDEYYRQDGLYEYCTPTNLTTLIESVDFDGVPVNGLGEDGIYPMGKFRRKLNNSVLGGIPVHTSVWRWYMQTIDQSLTPTKSDWFTVLSPSYLKVSEDPVVINEIRATTGYYYSNEGGGYGLLANVNSAKKISVTDMNQRTINRTGETLNPIFNRKFQYGKAGWNLNGGNSQIATIGGNKAIIKSDLKLDFRHSLMYFPSDAAIIRVRAKYSNSGDYGANLQVKFYDDKGNSKVLVLPNGQTALGFRYFTNFTSFNNYYFALPTALKGKVGTFSISLNGAIKNASVVIEDVQLMNISGQNLKIDNTNDLVSTTNSTYFDFPVTYNVNPTPLIKGVRPSSFNAIIQNTLPSTWNGTLTMTWRKVTDVGKGIPLVSKGVSLAPNATVTLDRGTQEIISEAGDYVLSIYANNDTDPIDRYYFYVEEPDEITSQSVSVSPSSSNFGFGNVLATTSKSQTFTITNTSNTNVNISGYTVTGTGFTQGTANTGTITPNQSKTITVQFQPNAIGAYNGNLQINGTFDGAPLNITLSGTGYQTTPPVNGCLESSVASVNITTGNTNAPRQQFFTLSNTSQSGSLTVNSIQFTGADAQYFSYDTQLFSTPTTINKAVSTGFMVKVNGSLTQNRNYSASLNFTTNNASCSTLSIPVVAVNQNSSVSWVGPTSGYTTEYFNGAAHFVLEWQGYVQGTTPAERAVQIQYSIAGGVWTHVNQSSIDCTKGHSNDQINTDYFDLTDANSIGKKVQFRIKPCNTNVPWQYTGTFYVIESGFKPLQVLSPNGYEVLTGGETYDIKWKDLLGYSAVNLFYSIDNGNSWISIADNVSGEATYYRWTVPTGIKNSNCLVKITAANIADQSDQIFTIQPVLAVPITYSELSIAPIGCGATPNGKVNFRLLGGQAPYYVLFVEAGLGMNTINANYVTAGMSGLDKGFHTVIVTDANYNKASYTFYVPEKREYTVKPYITNDICSGGKGSISVNLAGDYPYPPVFTFSKDGQQLYTGNSGYLTNLSAGLYSVKVVDAESCTNEQTVFIDSSPGAYFPITPTITNTSCSGTIGAISLNVGTAQTPTYLWSNGATTQNLTALSAGQYSVNITDATGCVQTQKYEVFEDGGLVETSLGYNTNGGFNIFSLSQNKLYFSQYRSGVNPNLRLGILDNATGLLDFIQIPSLYIQANISLEPKKIVATATDIYVVVEDFQNNTNETHLVKISKATKQIIGRKIVQGYGLYYNIDFFYGKLFALRADNSMDIIDFATNTLVNKTFDSDIVNFDFNSTTNKLYIGSYGSKLYEYDVTNNTITRTANISLRCYEVKIIGSTIFTVGSIANDPNSYVESIDLNTFVSTVTTAFRNTRNFGWGNIFVKNNRYIYIPATSPKFIDVFDIQSKTSTSIPISTYGYDLQYDAINDKIYVRGGGSDPIIRIDNNKFDFTTAKTDVTCGSNNGSITLTIPNDGKTYTYLWSNGATTKDVTGLVTGSYTVTVTQTGGCALKKTISIVELSGAFVATVSPNAGGNICPSTSLALASSLGQSYVWYKDNVVIPNATSQTYNASIAGNYKVVVTNSSSCTATSNIVPVTVIPNSVSNFTFTASGNVATFTNTSTNGNQYLWSFGDNTTDTQFNPIKTYSSAGGTFSVKLKTTNSCGNFNEITKTVTTSCTQMYTLKTGSWNDITVWSCNRIPTSADIITVKQNHIITIPASYIANAKGINYETGGKIVNSNRLCLRCP